MYFKFIKNILTTLTLVVTSQSKQDIFSSEVLTNRDEFRHSTFDIDSDSTLNLRRAREGETVFMKFFHQYKTDDFDLDTNIKNAILDVTQNKVIIQKGFNVKWNSNPNNETANWYTNIQYDPTSNLDEKKNYPKKNYILIKRKRKIKGFNGSLNLDNIFHYHENIGIPRAIYIRRVEARQISYSRIVKGRQVTIGQFPYAAGLIIKLKNGHTSIGGATLISRDRLVTAGHCWKDEKDEAKELTVVLGSLTLFKGGTRIKSNKVVLHPHFKNNYYKLRNDIAIIKLDTEVGFSQNIQKVDLPYGSMLRETFADDEAVIVGYGRQTEDQAIGKGQTLHHKTVQVIDNSRCKAVYLGKSVNERVVCAQSSTGTTCPGDSGSAMTVIRNNKPVLIGVATFGTKFCEQGSPTGFVRVTSYMKFLEENMGTK